MNKAIILKREKNQSYSWLKFYFNSESDIFFNHTHKLLAKFYIDDTECCQYPSSYVYQKRQNIVQLSIKNMNFNCIRVIYENLTQEQHNAIDAEINF